MSKEKDTENKKDRKWRLLLYPDDPTHVQAMTTLEEEGYKYAAILHDKDLVDGIEDDDDCCEGEAGSLKKPHWHVIIKFTNGVYPNSLAKDLGIGVNYLRKCKNFDEACKYLVHATKKSADKYQYDVEEVFGPLASYVAKLARDDDEGTRVLEIVKTIDSKPGRMSYRDLLVWCCKNGLYGEFRRLGAGAKYLLDEHNADIDS